MKRYGQTLARIGTGLAVLGSLIWLLWPSDLSSFLDPEPLFAFGTALVVWLITEFKKSEEASLDEPSPNDIVVAEELLAQHSGDLRWLLKDTDLWSFVDSALYSYVIDICDRFDRESLFFHEPRLHSKLSDFVSRLSRFQGHIAQHTVPEFVGGSMMTGFKPAETVDDEEYERRRTAARRANELASEAWGAFDVLILEVKKKLPQASAQMSQ